MDANGGYEETLKISSSATKEFKIFTIHLVKP